MTYAGRTRRPWHVKPACISSATLSSSNSSLGTVWIAGLGLGLGIRIGLGSGMRLG